MAFLGLVSWSLAVDTLRLLSICSFLVCSLSFTWYSFISLIAVLGELQWLSNLQVLSSLVRLTYWLVNSFSITLCLG